MNSLVKFESTLTLTYFATLLALIRWWESSSISSAQVAITTQNIMNNWLTLYSARSARLQHTYSMPAPRTCASKNIMQMQDSRVFLHIVFLAMPFQMVSEPSTGQKNAITAMTGECSRLSYQWVMLFFTDSSFHASLLTTIVLKIRNISMHSGTPIRTILS